MKFKPIRLFVLFLALLYQSPAKAQLQIDCRGQGPTLYLIGGGPAFTTWHLSPIQQRLQDTYRVCRWDMRGVGDNADQPIASDKLLLDQWLEDMAQNMPQEPVLLWGHSWGALQAMLFATRYPHRVAGIVLSNPVDPALDSLEQIEQKRYDHTHPRGGLRLEDYGTPAETLHAFRAKIASYFVDANQGWAYARQFQPRDTNSRLNVQIWDEYRESPLNKAAVRALAPTIRGVIYCREDVLMPQNYRVYSALLPADKHYVLDGCAHFPWEERPAAYFHRLEQSLEQAIGR